jgi:hypothetical protein
MMILIITLFTSPLTVRLFAAITFVVYLVRFVSCLRMTNETRMFALYKKVGLGPQSDPDQRQIVVESTRKGLRALAFTAIVIVVDAFILATATSEQGYAYTIGLLIIWGIISVSDLLLGYDKDALEEDNKRLKKSV